MDNATPPSRRFLDLYARVVRFDSRRCGKMEKPGGFLPVVREQDRAVISDGATAWRGESAMNDPDFNQDSQMDEDQMNEMIEQLCESKAEEFRLIGYDHVSGPDVWECVSDKYHKKGTPPLYQVVNDILSLKVTNFMNFITLNMYRGDTKKR
jgi:hypothetical protein